jgi:hypothetical protein
VDTGERKPVFGQQARRVKTTIDRQPAAGACDPSKQRVETDGWYIDAPATGASQPASQSADAPPATGCADRVEASATGDPKLLGFPIAYTMTITGDDGKPSVAAMEVTEFELTTLDPALFEIPAGLNAAGDLRQMAKALSDANEVTLAAADAAPATSAKPKTPGVIRIGVAELTNKTPQAVDTRTLRRGDRAEGFQAGPAWRADARRLGDRSGAGWRRRSRGRCGWRRGAAAGGDRINGRRQAAAARWQTTVVHDSER